MVFFWIALLIHSILLFDRINYVNGSTRILEDPTLSDMNKTNAASRNTDTPQSLDVLPLVPDSFQDYSNLMNLHLTVDGHFKDILPGESRSIRQQTSTQ